MSPVIALAARKSRILRGVLASTVLGGILLVAACLDATQIDAVVSADNTICAPANARGGATNARYAIRVRHWDSPDRLDFRTSEGELDRCEGAASTSYLGNFTLVPEKTEGRTNLELVQLMVDIDGNDPQKCEDLDDTGKKIPLPPNCIVIRRRVRFVEHEGFEVPMYLDDRCLGVSCEEDATCFRGGCVDASTTCDVAAKKCTNVAPARAAPGSIRRRPGSRRG